MYTSICNRCAGTGLNGECPVCDGTGIYHSPIKSTQRKAVEVLIEPGGDNPNNFIQHSNEGSIWDAPRPPVYFPDSVRVVSTPKRKERHRTIPHITQLPKPPKPDERAEKNRQRKAKEKARKANKKNSARRKNSRDQSKERTSNSMCSGPELKTAFEQAFEKAGRDPLDGSKGWHAFHDSGTGQFGSHPVFDPSDHYDE